MNHVQRASDWLRNNHIIVNNDWLAACVQWIQEENRGRVLSDDDINAQVYEQWLLADLHELETSCLPPEIIQAQKFELTGAYTLQIDSIVDVGVSFYSQQQKLKGTENANVHVNAEEPTQKPWEAKPSRMLMFRITDGTHNVQGMEYRQISCLNPQTSPGSKILIYGRVLCRHGVLMLSEGNIKFLGGEVDTLMEANTLANTLQSAMEGSEEHVGKEHKQVFSGSEVRHNKQPVTRKDVKPTPQVGLNTSYSDTNRNQQVWSRGQHRGSMKQEPVKQEVVTQRVNYQQNFQDPSDYDALLDDDMDDLMEEMNTESFDLPNHVAQKNTHISSGPTRNIARHGSGTVVDKRSQGQAPQTTKNSNSCKPSGKSVKRLNTGEPKLKQGSLVSEGQSVFDDDLVAMEFDDDMEFPQMDEEDFEDERIEGNVPKSVCETGTISAEKGRAPISMTEFSNDKITENKQQDQQCVRNSTVATSCLEIRQNAKNALPELPVVSDFISSGKSTDGIIDRSLSLLSTNKEFNSLHTTDSCDKISNGSSTTNSAVMSHNSSVVKVENNVKPSCYKQGKIENFFTPGKQVTTKEELVQGEKTIQSQDVQSEYPFIYLQKIMSQPLPEQPTYHTVKAYISTLTSKLTSTDGKWTLTCKINDGTMAVDVDLSDQVLTELIGFSNKEAQVMKQRVKTDTRVKEVLREGIQQCQQKLIELMCLLELELCAGNARPLIVATKPLTSSHIDLLYNRVMNLLNV